jgi:hypothetical protein
MRIPWVRTAAPDAACGPLGRTERASGKAVHPFFRGFVVGLIVSGVLLAATGKAMSARQAILHTFGIYGPQALRVSWCESRWHTWARNGQYLGLFQMGSWERSRYGHSTAALGQARAAYRYFIASGSDWSPWACKP